jgi:hypothetical protein
MRQTLTNLDELGKLKYAIECMEQNTPFPSVILDFLLQHGLYELITRPKVRYVTNLKSDT